MIKFSRYCVDTRSLYYYEDVDVFKNKLGIKDETVLQEAEDEITFRKVYELTYYPIEGYFGMSHLMKIHKYIFEDVYYFAGKIRNEDIIKGQTKFCDCRFIVSILEELLKELKKDNFLRDLSEEYFFEKLVHYMAELNAIHPFREGNGRTIREFIRVLALKRGYFINWSRVNKDELLSASIASIHDETALKNCLIQCAQKI